MQKSKIKWAVIGLLLMVNTVVAAQEAAEEGDVVVVVKELIGEVISLTSRGDSQLICIAVDEENTDYIFLIDEEIKVVRKRSLNAINIGDTVRVKYHVITRTTKEGRQRSKQVAKLITFMAPAKKGLRSGGD